MSKRYYTIEDNQTLIYFQLPKVLMVAEKYNKLSNDAKLLYAYYFDLNRKSMKRGWKDEEGRYYIKFKNEKAMAFIQCKSEKLAKLKKQLEEFDLIETVRMGQGKTNRTYVLKLEYSEEDVYKVEELFDDLADDADETDEKADVRKSNIPTESNDVRKSNDKTFENRTSRDSKIEQQDVRKSNSIIKNDFIENDSIKNDINNNPNLNPNLEEALKKSRQLFDDTLWNADIPMQLKKWIRVKIDSKSLSITSEQILLIEEAYHHQINKTYVKPKCASDDVSGINDYEFSGSIAKMLDTVKDIHNMRGCVQTWVQKAFDFKICNSIKPAEEQSIPFYNWLEEY